ncbi:MAG: hypothetical protein IRZ16_11170, partial [Myxococcaceae bacterium]|nr:hypothetical protein [Myxococcaceae bacterium]
PAQPPAVRTEPVSGARVPIVPPPRTQSSASNPRAPITGRMLAMKLGTVESREQAERQLLQSEFAGDDVTQFDGLIDGNTHGRTAVERDDDPQLLAAQDFDGNTPAPGLTSRDTLKAVVGPIQSREGRRSAEVYRKVLDQFAVGANPRYDPDAPDKPRAHIFVWDVTRAMHCEIPHFLGGRELSLGLMVEWLRHEAPMRGWRRATAAVALMAANEGCPVVVVPKELRIKLMAMGRPGEAAPDGNPYLSAAALGRGNHLTVKEAFGVMAVEFFLHP